MPRYTPGRLLRAGVLLLSPVLSACTELGLRAVNVPSYFFSDMNAETDLHYGNKPHQKLDLYWPKEEPDGKHKLVVFVYGGDWTSGSKEGYYFVADALTSAGYTVAIADYAKYPEASFPTFVADIALALSWLAGSGGQFEQLQSLTLVGHSAGAHIAALLITDPSYLGAYSFPMQRIDAFVGLAGPYAYLPETEKYRNIFSRLDDYTQMQPLSFLSGKEPPMLLLHGADDTTVLPLHTRKFYERAVSLGVSTQKQILPDRGHANLVLALSRLQDRDNAVRKEVLAFLPR